MAILHSLHGDGCYTAMLDGRLLSFVVYKRGARPNVSYSMEAAEYLEIVSLFALAFYYFVKD